MILLITEKAFKKNAKKIAKQADYLICDGTGDESGDIAIKFSNVVAMEGMNPPAKLVSAKKKPDEISPDKLEKMERKYFKGTEFKSNLMAVVNGLLQTESSYNIIIILKSKVYKLYGKKIKKYFYKYFDVNFEFVYLWDEVEDCMSLLRKDLKKKQRKELGSELKKNEKRLKKSEK